MSEAFQILYDMREEIEMAIQHYPERERAAALIADYRRALQIVSDEADKQNIHPETQLALLQGKVEAYEKAINLLSGRN